MKKLENIEAYVSLQDKRESSSVNLSIKILNIFALKLNRKYPIGSLSNTR